MNFHLNSIILLMFEGRKICMNIHNLAISFICTGMKQSSLETSICFVIEKKKKKKKT